MMAINFDQHHDVLVSSYKDVIDDSTKTNWSLYGYEKQSNVLTFLAKGEDGLCELADELNSARIMYAFCKLLDPNTELPKYVIINWQGEAAPLARKGLCANHINDVSRFFKGTHMTINARTEDDVEPSLIMSKLAKTTSTTINFKEKSEVIGNTEPVGTNYKRIQPAKEINTSEREKFWTSQQEDEKKRRLLERRNSEDAKVKFEEEEKVREIKSAKARDENVKKKEIEIMNLKKAEQDAEDAMVDSSKPYDDNRTDIDARVVRSDSLKMERMEETKTVIQRGSLRETRSIFEQNSSAGQLYSRRSQENGVKHNNEQQAAKPIENISVKPTENSSMKTTENNSAKPVYHGKEYLNITENPVIHTVEDLEEVRDDDTGESNDDEDALETNYSYPLKYPLPEQLEDIAEEIEHTEEDHLETNGVINLLNNMESGLRARALYDYQAADETEISFDPNDIVTHIEQIDEGWWQGMGPDGTYGLFPANYVELID